MAGEKKILTYAGLRALEDELENLKVVKRKEVAVERLALRFTHAYNNFTTRVA